MGAKHPVSCVMLTIESAPPYTINGKTLTDDRPPAGSKAFLSDRRGKQVWLWRGEYHGRRVEIDGLLTDTLGFNEGNEVGWIGQGHLGPIMGLRVKRIRFLDERE
jgi:hypothetical protein